MAKKLCEAVGVVNKESSLVEVDRGNVMRVRVKVDVTLPLCRGQIFKLGNGSKGWVSFKYEQLPNVCYWCGRLNHVDKDCDRWIQSSGTLTKEDHEYVSWLCASPLLAHNNSVLVVPGFYETKKKEIGMDSKQRGKTSTGTHGAARGREDTVEQGGISVDVPLCDKMNVVNAPIMTEDIMDVTHKEAATDDDLESLQLGKGAGFQGDLFNEKIREINSELKKFELEKDSIADSILIVEMENTKNGKPEYCGIMLNKSYNELAACEELNKKDQHVTINEGNPNDLEPHVTREKTKEQEITAGVAVNVNSTWKRIVQKETNSLAVVPPLKSLKRTGTELLNSELPKKKKQVSHDDQDTTIELAGSDIQPYQK
uniref:CCHC-type domain-containing protein n=1 Tax=Quercus lobata TaxID=97700 RepID=A0A7N2R4N7_QUELO